jgi:hypothetical protein
VEDFDFIGEWVGIDSRFILERIREFVTKKEK